MPRQLFRFDPPDRFVAGTVGEPGERTFFLQATAGTRIVSVALEKAQVAVLAERLDDLLDTVRRSGVAEVPLEAPEELDDRDPLSVPIEEEFRVGAMGLAWEGIDERVVIEAMAQTEGETEVEPLSDAEEGPDALRVRLTPAMALAFVSRAERVVAAGRPPCPLCSLPLDPGGHLCPRHNGYRR
ncbi:MAG TPA: DUF3090 domain-containing protein [Mycobacteriales bacterium]|nr:DUF3090 domain-containing protein [Mycobacteriales bacterium]